MNIKDDLLCYGRFKPEPKDDFLGTYAFFVAVPDEVCKPFVSVLIYSASVRENGGHVLVNYEDGDPPNAKDGRALDLHRAAVARVKSQAQGLMNERAYFIGDDGRMAEASAAGLSHRLGVLYDRLNPKAPPAAHPAP